MNPEIKAKWIEALRSGKYRQTKEYLKRGDKYCCLGVLCEVAGFRAHKEEGRWFYAEESQCLPAAVLKKVGLRNNKGALRNRKVFRGEACHSLADLNDAGADFNFIADVIEKQL